MGNLRVAVLLALAACGSSSNNSTDAPRPIDAAADAKVFLDAPIDSPPNYDLSCFGQPPPTTAANPITVAGTTDELGVGGATPVAAVTVAAFKTGTTAALSTVTSDAMGNFTTGNLNTGGVPLDGYLKASKGTTYRATYLYPPNPLVANAMNIPVLLVTPSTFTQLAGFLMFTQDDTQNGALLVAVTDCSGMPINGAMITAKQGGADAGTVYDLGALSSMAAGLFIVANVPDGATDVGATYSGMTFPAHSVVAHKQQGTGMNVIGTLTITQVRPGP